MTHPDEFGTGRALLGRYEFQHYIARGGMGAVYAARDTVLERDVALKRITFAGQSAQDEADNRARSLREARVGAALGAHHRIISIYDRQEIDGDVWLVMEYLDSVNLDHLAGDSVVDIGEAARIGAAIAEALAHAHACGVVHRDVKPANVLLSPDGQQIKLADFGIAHRIGGAPVTAADTVTGTVEYMPREIARGDDTGGPHSDIYSLGATLYRIVEGVPPHGEDDNPHRLLQRIAHEPSRPPEKAGEFGTVLAPMLDPNPATRWTADGARRQLEDFARRHRSPTLPPTVIRPPDDETTGGGRRRRYLIAGAAIAVLLAVVGSVALLLPRSGTTGVPAPVAAPVSTAPVALTGDFKAANPCALLDPTAMSRFGSPRVGPGSNIGECRITTASPNGDSMYTDVYYGNVVSGTKGDEGALDDRGRVRVLRRGVDGVTCNSSVLFQDGNYAAVRTYSKRRTTLGICDTNEVALRTATDRLLRDGVTYDPGWQTTTPLAARNACELSQVDAPALIPDLGPRLTGTPNGAICYLGVAKAGPPYLDVRLGLEPNGDVSKYGRYAAIGGKATYTSTGTAHWTGNAPACVVYIVHRQSFDSGARTPTELVTVASEGAGPPEIRCQQALDVGLAVERKL